MVQAAILGIGIAAIYTLLGQGIVLIYRGSGVVNLAHGAYAMAGALTYYELSTSFGLNFWPSFIASVLAVGIVGAATYLLVMVPLRRSSPISRLIGTLGVLIVIQSIALLQFGSSTVLVASFLPNGVLEAGGLYIGQDRVILFGIALVLTAALWSVSRYTLFGLASRAVAENQRVAATLGWSPHRVATLNWVAGAMLAAAAGILIVPLTGLQATNLTLIVIAALAVALIGGFSSFPLTLLGGLVIGIGQSEVSHFWQQQGVADSLPLAVIILILMFRGRRLPVRGMIAERLPKLGTGRVRLQLVVPLVAAFLLLVFFVFPADWNQALSETLLVSIILLSLVLLTGYAGQVSLAQYALGGLGAFVTGRLIAAAGWPSWTAIVVGIFAAVVIGLVFALPALRTRGVNLAVVTLGLGLSLQSLLFNNTDYTGGIVGTNVGPLNLFGLSFDPITYPERFTALVFMIFTVCALIVCNVRRSRVGRRMIAVRSNERAAASIGINVTTTKLYAFGLSSAFAGVGGIFLGLSAYTIVFTNYDPISSIYAVGLTVIGGVGYVAGALFGATLSQTGIGPLIGTTIFGTNIGNWLALFGGVVLILLLIQDPDGVAAANIKTFRRLLRRVHSERPPGSEPASLQATSDFRVRPRHLEAAHLSVRFGGVLAVGDVSIDVGPAEVVGLIGPNGAGKTTLIDALTGFVGASGGSVRLDGVSIDRWGPERRAQQGVTRSFQSLELFEDLTVRENLLAASDRPVLSMYITDLAMPRRRQLSAAAVAAVERFELAPDLDRPVIELPFGRRRLVGIARAIATGASLILLDEPAAGLSETERRDLETVVRHMAQHWGMGVLMVEHDVSIVMSTCDRVVVMDFGRVLAQGTPDFIRNDPRVIAAYLGVAPAFDAETAVASSISGQPVEGGVSSELS